MIGRCDPWFRVLGLAWLTPVLRILSDDYAKGQIGEIWRLAVVPVLSIAAFLLLWANLAPMVQTSLGAIPGPAQVCEQVGALHADAVAEGQKRADFYAGQAENSAALVAAGKSDEGKERTFAG